MNFENSVFYTYPVVFAIKDTYQISVCVTRPTVMWVNVNGKNYYDHSNGILKSDSFVHKMTVPASELNKAKIYTICYREIIERKPYFSNVTEEDQFTFDFFPYESGDAHIYHISDTHNRVNAPIKAGEFFSEELDVLVLNGDIPDHSGDIENFKAIYKIAGGVSKGNKPVIFSRGNHDMRGVFAEKFAEYTPTENGKSYYTVRLGDMWCLVLDAGEDKSDDHNEYGHTICCHTFREEETEFIDDIIQNADNEYNAEGVKKRIIIAHTPFTYILKSPFDIEKEIYADWVKKIRKNIRPDFYLCGHLHECSVIMPGDKRDNFNQGCPVVVGARPTSEGDTEFEGCAITYTQNDITVKFTNQDKTVVATKEWEIKR